MDHDHNDIQDLSDDDSDESVDIIETTMHNAVERALTIFLPLLHDRPFGLSERELMVFDVSGASVSYLNFMYDHQFSISLHDTKIRNGLGAYFLKIGPIEHDHVRETKIPHINGIEDDN
eukprot:5962220-Ditylum_brightwellii.AAC.1